MAEHSEPNGSAVPVGGMMLDIVEDLLSRLENVKSRGTRWSACCPAHADTTPSLSISEGQRGILLKCWSGCSITEICAALAIKQSDLFFDALASDPTRRRAAAQEREQRRHARERQAEQDGDVIDSLREAEYFVQSRRGLDISTWTDATLDDELGALADAYLLLEREKLHE